MQIKYGKEPRSCRKGSCCGVERGLAGLFLFFLAWGVRMGAGFEAS